MLNLPDVLRCCLSPATSSIATLIRSARYGALTWSLAATRPNRGRRYVVTSKATIVQARQFASSQCGGTRAYDRNPDGCKQFRQVQGGRCAYRKQWPIM